MKRLSLLLLSAFIIASCSRQVSESTDSFPLKEYVFSEDDPSGYTITDTVRGDNYKIVTLKLISGHWLTEKEVDQTQWWHWLSVIIPDEVKETEAMMMIGGGAAHDTLSEVSGWLIRAAVATRSIIARISNIPYQPLDYKKDEKGMRYEDDLIAYGWRQYLESGADESHLEWLARFPMTRAVVRGMDAVEEISRLNQSPVDAFFVTGASKRGWTTWTTAAVDERVIGIAPLVIDLLNIKPSFRHHWQCYGEWSPAVEEYVNEGIMDWMNTVEFKSLLETVAPYSFAGGMTIPKYLINGTCDEFFVTDSWQFYWDDLPEEKYLYYVPNGNHGLRNYFNPLSLIAFYHAVITGADLPDFTWNTQSNTINLQVDPESDYLIRKWEAVNDSARDFRIYVVGDTAWKPTEIEPAETGSYSFAVATPEAGYRAALVELVFNPDSDFPLTFTTGTLIMPDTYPFGPFRPESDRGTPVSE